jgi:transaldolase/glucose-6-phosphate isomerase
MDAFREHGEVTSDVIEQGVEGAHALLTLLDQEGVSLKEVTEELAKDGVQQFADAFDKLFGAIAMRRQTLLEGNRTPLRLGHGSR